MNKTNNKLSEYLSEETKKNLKLSLTNSSLIFIIIGILLLLFSISLLPNNWVQALITHFGITFLLIGAIEVWYNFYTKQDIIKQINESVVEALSYTPEVLKSLSATKIEDMTLGLLVASMEIETDQARAIYDNLIKYYLDPNVPHKERLKYDISIASFDEDIDIKLFSENKDEESVNRLILKQSEYYRLSETFDFTKKYDSNIFSIGCVFEEPDLIEWINRPNCIFREVLFLRKEDKENLERILIKTEIQNSRFIEEFSNLFEVNVDVDNSEKKIDSIKIVRSSDSGKEKVIGIEFYFNLEDLLSPRPVNFKIELSTYIAKEHHRYPVVIVERTHNPEITFTYEHAEDVKAVICDKFFTETKPYVSPKYVSKHNKIVIKYNKQTWVFPMSGVVFFWVNGTEDELKKKYN